MKIDRLFKISMMCLVLIAFAVACSAPAATPVPPTKPAAAPTTAAAPTVASAPKPTETASKPVDIEIWAIPTSSQAPAPSADWIGYKIVKDKLNINLKYVALATGQDGETKLNAAAAANALPDFFQTYSTSAERNKLIDLNKQGLVAPLDDLLPLMPNRVKTHYNDPNSFALGKLDGKQMGFVEVANLPRREGLVIRKDWLDKLGLKMPTTMDELLTVAKAFTEKDPDGNGKNDTYGLGGFFDGTWGAGSRFDFMFGAYGVAGLWNYSDPNNFGLSIHSPNYQKAVAMFKQFNDAKVIDPDWVTINRDEFRVRWPQGRYGIMWEDFGALATAANYPKFDNNFPTGEWVPVPAPKGPDGKAYYGVYASIGNIFAMSKKAADAGKGPAIAKLLEWMTSPEGYYLYGFGVEGTNYKLDKDGVVITDGLADPKQAWNAEATQSLTQMRNQLVYNNDPKEVQARYPSFPSKNGRTISPMSFYQYFSTQPWVNFQAQQLILNPTNLNDLKTFYNTNMQAFMLGTKPLNDQTWGDFVKAFDNLGGTKWESDAKKNLQDAGILKK